MRERMHNILAMVKAMNADEILDFREADEARFQIKTAVYI